MKKYDVILFDLDGTLTDPAIGITNSVIHSLKKYGIDNVSREELYKFIGPPLHESYQKFFGFSEEESFRAVEYYREYYKSKGIYENLLYEGIEDLLKAIKESGKKIVLATSKPEIFAREILRYFKLDSYFTFAAGANLDGSRTVKAEVISYALDSIGITDFTDVVMVGDREHDIIGAKTVGIDSVGVLFGYGSREELENAGADYITDTVSELKSLLI